MMKTHLLLSLLFAASFLPAKAQTYQPSAENLKARQEFQDNKFGIFLHWGLYCMLATGECLGNSHNTYSRLLNE